MFDSKRKRDAKAALDEVQAGVQREHSVYLDANSHRDDVAFQAVCETCPWVGLWYHSEDYGNSVSRAELEAQTDAAVHIASMQIAEAKSS